MFTIKTATGKEFDSDYAVTTPALPIGFMRIVGQKLETVERIFSSPEEFPLQGYPRFHSASNFVDEGTGIKFVLNE